YRLAKNIVSNVAKHPKGLHVNIAIMRTFVKLRELLTTHRQLARKIEELEKKYDGKFQLVFDAIRGMMAEPDPPPKKRIGFQTHDS
ncbi:MAG: ORF6N domain-containing protein, partial [Patescibacteria group bacterium]